jgi:RHS repeat-associated protein
MKKNDKMEKRQKRSVTRYIYSATGEKLHVFHLTAVPNITVAMGQTRELAPSEILSVDSTDYLLGGTLTMRNGRIDKYLFDEGYCQAAKYASIPVQDTFTFYYFDLDHLGSVRQVVKADRNTNGTVVQRMEYYPSGTQLCDGRTDSDKQSRRYNGKELDRMHGLDTYDYGARQYNPVTARWDRMDPLAEKYYSVSPYAYCGNNPMNYIDENGDSVRMIFNKDTKELHILDMDYYNPKKKLEYVTYNDYTVGKENQVLVIPFVFSGGEVGEEGNVVVNPDPRYREAEIGLPNGVYDILDNSSDTNPDHYSWYRLDRIDNTRYNDMDDKTGRIGFRLHLGTRSFGCVTINKNQKNSNAMWNVLVGIMKRTKTTRVKENRGRQWLNPFSYRIWYGKMAVIGGE